MITMTKIFITVAALVIATMAIAQTPVQDSIQGVGGISTPQFCSSGSVAGLNSSGQIVCQGVDAGTNNQTTPGWTVTAQCNFTTQASQVYSGGDGGVMTLCGIPWQVINPGASSQNIAINSDGGGLSIFPGASNHWKMQTQTRTAPFLMTPITNLGVTSLGQQMRFTVWLHDQSTDGGTLINFDGFFSSIWAPAVSTTVTMGHQATIYYNGGPTSDFEWSNNSISGAQVVGVLYDGGININTADMQFPLAGMPGAMMWLQHANTPQGGTPPLDSLFIPVGSSALADFSSFNGLMQSFQTWGFSGSGFGAPANGIPPGMGFLYAAFGCSTFTGLDAAYNCNLGGYRMEVK